MTPEEKAQEFVNDPKWRFIEDPTNAIARCSVVAAEHATHGRRVQSVWWASVGAELVRIADNPKIQVGAVIGGILGGL
jgi:hypothetical protein